MSNVPIKDADNNTRKVDVFTRTEGADTVETQAVALVDPASGQLVLGAPADAAATDDTGSFSLVSLFKRALVYMAAVNAAIKGVNVAASGGDKGMVLLARRWDTDTATTTADGQYTTLKQDEAGRLKVATQPASMPAVSRTISAQATNAAFDTNRVGTLVISMVANNLVGHNAVFEYSLDSTDGNDGSWKTVQAVRSDSNIVETSTGVLTATPAYGWELNVAAYSWVRVRPTAHVSGDATYTFKPGAYATEPVPSSQNPPMQTFTFAQAGVIAINTVLMVLDCANFRSLSIQCLSMGTTGAVIYEWSNDGSAWQSNFNAVSSGSNTNASNGATLLNTPVYARYFRVRIATATTAGTTSFSITASQSASGTQIAQVIGNVALNSGSSRFGYGAAGSIWYDDSATALAANATFTGSSRDLTGGVAASTAFNTGSSYPKELRFSAESDQSGTLWLEVSRDNTNWRRVKSVATATVTGGAQYAEIVHMPSTRFARVGFTNGATLQTRFFINSFLLAA